MARTYPPPIPQEDSYVTTGPLGDDFREVFPLLPEADLEDPDALYFVDQVLARLPDCD